MIYLDNAATTYPKPPDVQRAVSEALIHYGANPGRGGHTMAMTTAERVYECREALASLFHLENPSGVVFTSNCTGALNLVIKGLLSHGGHAVITDCEHNSVIRPLTALAEKGVTFTTVSVDPKRPYETAQRVRRAIRPTTRLILCTHASNVLGVRTPIRQIGQIAQKARIPFAVDAAQTAGILPIDMENDHINFLCIPAHKGLYGPMGCGALLCRGNYTLEPLMEGGTGSASLLSSQPNELPDRLESGTLNVPAICGLYGGLEWLKRQGGCAALAERETALLRTLYAQLTEIKGIEIYTPYPNLQVCVPLLTCNVQGLQSEETAARLNEQGIAVRAGLHCAPSAHRKMGTIDRGAVRICPSAFTTRNDLEKVRKILTEIAINP